MQDIVIYDALSITSKIHSPADFVALLGLQDANWTCVPGAKGYRQRMYFECISIHFDGSEDQGIWLEMLGQGCRAFETYGTGNYEALFAECFSNEGDMKITRLDVAYDDHVGLLDMDVLVRDTVAGEYVSRFQDWDVHLGSKGTSVTHGSMSSEIFLRIYDKAAERRLTDGSHWIRVELQLRRDRAWNFVKQGGSIGENFAGVIRNYIRYVDSDGSDSNRWRWPLKLYWSALLDNASALRLYVKPGVEYNYDNLQRYVLSSAGNAIDAYIKIRGLDGFLSDLKHRGTMPNPKYDELVDRYSRGGRDGADGGNAGR